jgi:predicted DNA-binding transcriptional regulator YafY
VLVPPRGGPLVDPEVLLTLAQGCRMSERVSFDYRDGSGNESERRVEPYSLVNAEQRWYLVARDLDRDDWRTFRLDRMSRSRLTGHRFTPGPAPDAATMVADGFAAAPWAWHAEVVLRTTVADARAEIPRTVGTVEEAEGGALFRLGAHDLDWIARYLAGLPFDVFVRTPPELRDALRALGRKLQRAHR